MIYIEKSQKVETNITNEVQDFKIAMNSKTFRLLSDTLYSDKIKAIIRELSCNAYDSHVEANNEDTPFEVNLPTLLNQEFSIRDYGVGLSEEMLTTLYLTYGESTKDNSNKLVGCFGIGSKSPFAYVDMFNVVSYYDGQEKTYSVFLDNGIPKCVKIHEEDSIEASGLRISFNVLEKDINNFVERAKSVFNHFKTKPLFNIDLDIPKEDFNINKDGYAININGSGQRIYAHQGNISYPVDKSFLNNLNLSFYSFVLKFEIGEFSFAPSREALSYDEKTINALNKKIEESIEDFYREMFLDIQSQQTLSSYMKTYLFYYRKTNFNLEMMYDLGVYEFQGKIYKHEDFLDLKLFNSPVIFKYYTRNPMTGRMNLKRLRSQDTFDQQYLFSNQVIVFNDLQKSSNITTLVNLSLEKGIIKNDNILLVNNKSLGELRDVFGDSIITLSEYIKLDELLKKHNAKSKEIVKNMSVLKHFLFNDDVSTSVVIDKEKTYYYLNCVTVRKYEVVVNILNTNSSLNRNSYNKIKKTLLSDNEELIFISKGYLKNVELFDNIHPFGMLLEKKKEVYSNRCNKDLIYFDFVKSAKFFGHYDFFKDNIQSLIGISDIFIDVEKAISFYEAIDSDDIIMFGESGYGIINKIFFYLFNFFKSQNLESNIYKELVTKAPLIKTMSRGRPELCNDYLDYLKLILNKS